MQLLTQDHQHYPQRLLHLAQPPAQLYAEGNLAALSKIMVAVVGSRKMSLYARQVIGLLVRPMVHAGVVVVSGLAYGADAAAHRLVVEQGGVGVAVLAHGLDRCYPSSQQGLRSQLVAQQGLVLSEYEPGTPPLQYRFLARNRIVAALSQVVLIVEAGEKSGTFATAQAALECGREVCVVPGDITRTENLGGLALLKQGARPVSCAEDILGQLALATTVSAQLPLRPALTGLPSTLYNLLRSTPMSSSRLASHTGEGFGAIQATLTVLELDGHITYRDGIWLANL